MVDPQVHEHDPAIRGSIPRSRRRLTESAKDSGHYLPEGRVRAREVVIAPPSMSDSVGIADRRNEAPDVGSAPVAHLRRHREIINPEAGYKESEAAR